MKRWLLIVLLLGLASGGIWFWLLGRISVDEEPRIVLSETSGDVQLKSGADKPFLSIGPGAELSAGDVVKTGPGASATLDFYGENQSRLDQNTEVTITAANPPEEVSSEIRIKLETGRIWSRVLRVLDLDKAFSIETSDVVATVRGTAFDVEKLPGSPSVLRVSESVVEANGVNGAMGQVFIPQSSQAEFVSGRRTTSTRALAASDLMGKWFKQNQEADRHFVSKRLEKLRGSLNLERIPGSGIMREIARGSESIRERLGSLSRRDAATQKILIRRLGLIRSEIERGNSGAAAREYAEFERALKVKLAKADVRTSRLARTALGLGLRLFEDIRPGQDGYGLKQQIEDLMIVTGKTQAEQATARLMAIDTHLDESAALIFQLGDVEAGKTATQVALSSIQNTEREVLEMNLTVEEREQVNNILQAFRVRAEDLLRANPLPPGSAIPLSAPVVSTSTDPGIKPLTQTATTTVQKSDLPECTSIRLIAQPNPVAAGAQTVLSVKAVLADGASQDVTSNATYTVFGNLGSLSRNVFTARTPGSLRIEAALACASGLKRHSIELRITDPVRLQTLTLEPALRRMRYGETVAFRAIASFSNGQTRDVSNQTSYALTNPQLGSLTGNVFTSGQSDGTLRITAAYQENGVSVNGGADIVITAQ